MHTKLVKHGDPTVKQTLSAIRSTGCKATYDSDYKEFRISPPNAKGTASAYFTPDRLDAIQTAESLAAGVAPLYTTKAWGYA